MQALNTIHQTHELTYVIRHVNTCLPSLKVHNFQNFSQTEGLYVGDLLYTRLS